MEGEQPPIKGDIFNNKKKTTILPESSNINIKKNKEKISLGHDFLGLQQNTEEIFQPQSYQPYTTELIKIENKKINEYQIPPTYSIYVGNEKKIYFSAIPTQTQEAEKYQKKVLTETIEDPSITDYSVAYKRLIKERNKPWKLNPSDIADFYLLEGYISEHEGSVAYQEDPTYLAVAKAKGRVSDIGRRLLVSLAHEQLDEYDRFATINSDSVPDELRSTIHEHYQERVGQGADPEAIESMPGIEQEINAYLADFNAMIEEYASRGETLDIFTHEDTNTMFGNALGILESQQRGRWQVMAKAMRALHNNSIPMSEFVQSITTTDGIGISQGMEAQLERQREPFLIDRLLNYVHNTGTMSARVTNYFPRAASLLLAHGRPGHDDYLLYHSSVGYGNDTLGRGVQQYARRVEGNTLVEDLTTAMHGQGIPREYKYAMMLEFGDEGLHEAVQTSTSENITPSRAYTLLQRVSHHDGHSRGRLK